jgi:preprotein translocase subunit SecG
MRYKERDVQTILNIVQLTISILLISLILLQVRGSGLGRTFGSDSGSVRRTRRGIEKTIFQMTIVVAVAFVLVSLANAVVVG